MNAQRCLMPLTICSGMIEGAEQWESYKLLQKAMKTGRAEDVRAACAAAVRDMQDPKKAQAYNDGARNAEISERTARILRRDNGEIGKLVSEAIKAKKEADRLKEKAERCRKALDTARQQMKDAAKELTAGINETAVKRYHSSRAEIVRLTEKIEGYEEEIAAQREKMNAQYGKAVNLAQGKAKREMLQDAERARKRREKRAQMQRAESAAEKETKAMAERERAEEKTPPQEERENEETKREGHEEAEREQTLMMNEAEME